MFRNIVLIVAIAISLMLSNRVNAEQTLRVFNADDYHPHTNADESWPTTAYPLYGGSDQTAYGFNFNGRADKVELFTFDLAHAVIGEDAIVGVASASCELILRFDDKVFSSVVLDRSSEHQPFRLPIPEGFLSGRLTLCMVTPNNVSGNRSSGAIANVRLVHGFAPATESPAIFPQNATSGTAPVGLSERGVREFSGNDFDSHFESNTNYSWPLQLHREPGQLTVTAYIAPVEPPRTIPMISLDDPPVDRSDYAITGDITYGGADSDSDIDGVGYLEMQSDFADGTSTFTRAQADSGPMRLIRGRSGPRPFQLPMHSDKHPTRIRMNLVMSGRGTVSMNNLRLVQYVPPVLPVAAVTGGDSLLLSRRMIWVPVVVLPFFGLVALLEPMVRRGRGRLFVIGWIWSFFALAQLCFAWTMAAWGHGLPMREVSPALLVSVLILGGALFASRRMSRRYRDVELRKMQLMDAV